ncbi:zinc finger protein Xfin isoform X2 [Hydra vulgaris]|uniref:Transcription factor ZNF436 n=1 Tax=Hydra vulgaris TaxID=6087 RepID=I3V7V8_HYDVU|nr:transcription factor ZNF436 [Hydra vulgaris]
MTIPNIGEQIHKIHTKTTAEQGVLCLNKDKCQTNAFQAECKKDDADKSSKYKISVIKSLSALEDFIHDEKNEQKKLPYGGRPLRFQCTKCLRRFHAPSHLKRHMLCHTTERPYQCYICNKGFLQAWHLGRHMTTHTGNKPFSCQECSKSFGSRFEMKTHYNYVHQGIKDHKCGVCHKMFTLRSNLKVHMRKHTGEKPYECSICMKRFGQRGHLQYHFKKHASTSCLIQVSKGNKVTSQNSDVAKLVSPQKNIIAERILSINIQKDQIYKSKMGNENTQEKSFKEENKQPVRNSKQKQYVNSSYKINAVPLSGRIFDHVNPSSVKAFVCVTCNCGFGEINSLKAHVRHSHPKKKIFQGMFECAHCNKNFSEILKLQDHFETVHSVVTAPSISESETFSQINAEIINKYPKEIEIAKKKFSQPTSTIFFPSDLKFLNKTSSVLNPINQSSDHLIGIEKKREHFGNSKIYFHPPLNTNFKPALYFNSYDSNMYYSNGSKIYLNHANIKF